MEPYLYRERGRLCFYAEYQKITLYCQAVPAGSAEGDAPQNIGRHEKEEDQEEDQETKLAENSLIF